jgi:hypothetical protein
MALLPVTLALAWVAVVTVFVSAGVAAARADRRDAAERRPLRSLRPVRLAIVPSVLVDTADEVRLSQR